MIKLNFQINKYYLAYILLNKSGQLEEFSDSSLGQKIKVFRKNLWENYKNDPPYYFIHLVSYKHIKWAIETIYLNSNSRSPKTQIKKLSKDIQKIFQVVFHSQEFKRILEETTQYKNLVEHQWDQNKAFVLNYLEEIIGKKLPNLSLSVIIIHPGLKEGRVSSKKFIIWGHLEDWPNYTTVYLTHELLHVLFDYYKLPKNELSHAIIELISDNELRVRLNQKGKYFREGRKHVGHSCLRKIEKQILPYWFRYLKNEKRKNIYVLCKQLEKKIKVKK